MYDFGFYLEHSVYFRDYLKTKFAGVTKIGSLNDFRDYLKTKFAGGTKIGSLNDFDTIMKNFQQSATFANYFGKVDMVPAQPTNYLNAFGIRFFKIYKVEMNYVTEKAPQYPVNKIMLDRCDFWDSENHAKNVKEKLEDNSVCATSDGKWPGTYIWKFSKNGEAEFYVGETDDIIDRLKKYNGANKGQTPNITINNRIWKAKRNQENVELYFYPTEHHHDDVEQYLLHCDPKKQWFTLNKKI